VAGTGEGHEHPARREEAKGVEVDVLVATRRALHIAARSCKRRRIANDEIELRAVGRALADVAEGIGNKEAGRAVQAVEVVIDPRQLDGLRRNIHVLHMAGPARRCVDAERSAV
jgi:hypothetical protein